MHIHKLYNHWWNYTPCFGMWTVSKTDQLSVSFFLIHALGQWANIYKTFCLSAPVTLFCIPHAHKCTHYWTLHSTDETRNVQESLISTLCWGNCWEYTTSLIKVVMVWFHLEWQFMIRFGICAWKFQLQNDKAMHFNSTFLRNEISNFIL